MSELVGIKAEYLDRVWDVVLEHLRPAIKRAQGTITEESLYEGIKCKNYQLWASINNDEAEAFAITVILNYPGVKVLGIPLIGGKNRYNWLGFEPTFMEYGRSHGCEYIETYLRMGWAGLVRKLSKSVLGKEWTIHWVLSRKSINKESEV